MYTEQDIIKFHRTLHQLCGLPQLTPSINDQRTWHDFLLELKPLEETEEGPFTVADLTAAVSVMAYQKRKGVANWSLRPSSILRDPEKFRDMVLQARSDLRLRSRRKAPQRIQELPGGGQRALDEAETVPEGKAVSDEALALLDEFKARRARQ